MACTNLTLKQLRNIASINKDKVRNYSKLNKEELCQLLITTQLIQPLSPRNMPVSPKRVMFQNQPEIKEIPARQPRIGITPPPWDEDSDLPIPTSLLPYWYIYSTGHPISNLQRLFILPEDYPLLGIQFSGPANKPPRIEFPLTVGQYHHRHHHPIIYQGNEVRADVVIIQGITNMERGINRVAPPLGSEEWNQEIGQLVIIAPDDNIASLHPQLRRQYQTIQEIHTE